MFMRRRVISEKRRLFGTFSSCLLGQKGKNPAVIADTGNGTGSGSSSGAGLVDRGTITSNDWIPERGSSGKLIKDTFSEYRERETRIKKVNISPKFVKQFGNFQTYDPFDFSIAKLNLENRQRQEKSRFVSQPKNIKKKDIFTSKNLNPLDFYCSPVFLSNFLTSSGQILPREQTNLTLKNQRLLAKAIKRCRAIGLISNVSRDVSVLPSVIQKGI